MQYSPFVELQNSTVQKQQSDNEIVNSLCFDSCQTSRAYTSSLALFQPLHVTQIVHSTIQHVEVH